MMAKTKLSEYDLDVIREEYPATYDVQLEKIKKALDKRRRQKESKQQEKKRGKSEHTSDTT